MHTHKYHIWKEMCYFITKYLKRQKDKKTKRQQDKKTKRQKDKKGKKTKRQNDKRKKRHIGIFGERWLHILVKIKGKCL